MSNTQKENSDYFLANKFPELVNFGKSTYISILGNGYPGSTIFYQKKKALSDFCFELKSQLSNTSKNFDNEIIEIFYWFNEELTGFVDIGKFYTTVDLENLNYRMAIKIPDTILDNEIQSVSNALKRNPFI